MVNSILEQAVNDGASDIHIEAMETEVRIRLRIDGTLTQILSTPKKAQPAIITRIKIMGNLNIAEKRLPQDGRCELDILGHNIDVRISTLPTVYGEKGRAPPARSQFFPETEGCIGLHERQPRKIRHPSEEPSRHHSGDRTYGKRQVDHFVHDASAN